MPSSLSAPAPVPSAGPARWLLVSNGLDAAGRSATGIVVGAVLATVAVRRRPAAEDSEATQV